MLSDLSMEVRFTRARQAVVWWLLAVFFLLVPMLGTLMAILPSPWGAESLRSYWWLLPFFLGISYGCGRLAVRCVRRAYLIFSPVGVEIFPFYDPANHLEVVQWSQIDHAEVKKSVLILHFDAAQTCGKVISLAPISRARRALVAKLMEERSERPVHS